MLLREVLERSGIVSCMTARLKDPRSPVDVTHDLPSLIRTGVLLAAQGWRGPPCAAAGRALSLCLSRPGADAAPHVTDETFSIHFYGRRMRARLREKFDGLPRPRSLVGQLLKRHGIDPALAPLPQALHAAAPDED